MRYLKRFNESEEVKSKYPLQVDTLEQKQEIVEYFTNCFVERGRKKSINCPVFLFK